MITSETHHFEIQYRYKDVTYTTVICTGIIDNTDIVTRVMKTTQPTISKLWMR